MNNQTVQSTIGIVKCMQETALGDIVIGLVIYGLLTSLFIFILLIIIFRLIKGNKKEGAAITNG